MLGESSFENLCLTHSLTHSNSADSTLACLKDEKGQVMVIRQGILDIHRSTCPLERVLCPICNLSMLRKDLNQHNSSQAGQHVVELHRQLQSTINESKFMETNLKRENAELKTQIDKLNSIKPVCL